MRRPLYDEKKSQKRDRQAQLVEEFFDTSHSSEEVLYDAVTSVNVCVFSRPLQMCEANEEFTSCYNISIPAKCMKRKEMQQNLSPREQISPMNCRVKYL